MNNNGQIDHIEDILRGGNVVQVNKDDVVDKSVICLKKNGPELKKKDEEKILDGNKQDDEEVVDDDNDNKEGKDDVSLAGSVNASVNNTTVKTIVPSLEKKKQKLDDVLHFSDDDDVNADAVDEDEVTNPNVEPAVKNNIGPRYPSRRTISFNREKSPPKKRIKQNNSKKKIVRFKLIIIMIIKLLKNMLEMMKRMQLKQKEDMV